MKMVEKQIRTTPHKSRRRGRRGPKRGTIYIPPAQQEKMKGMFLKGMFIAEIARETERDWKTVAKVVRSTDMLRYMDECRAKAREVIPDILEMVHTEMKKPPNKDRVRAGIDYLARARVFEEIQIPTLVSATHGACIETRDEKEIRENIAAYVEMAWEMHKIMGLEMPGMELVKAKMRLDGKKVETTKLPTSEGDISIRARRAFPRSDPALVPLISSHSE